MPLAEHGPQQRGCQGERQQTTAQAARTLPLLFPLLATYCRRAQFQSERRTSAILCANCVPRVYLGKVVRNPRVTSGKVLSAPLASLGVDRCRAAKASAGFSTSESDCQPPRLRIRKKLTAKLQVPWQCVLSFRELETFHLFQPHRGNWHPFQLFQPRSRVRDLRLPE